jgi:hypothetical protein
VVPEGTLAGQVPPLALALTQIRNKLNIEIKSPFLIAV